jgi:CheY-like chemotaxis protein
VPHTLLLADDSVTIQRVIELTFADEDVHVVAVSDGDQAIAAIEHRPPDIVLADVGMPGRDGYQVAKHIKSTPRLAHIPVVLLTGAFEPIDQVRAAEAGCDGVLAKPFEPQLVIGRVRELLNRRPQVPPPIDPHPAQTPVHAPHVTPPVHRPQVAAVPEPAPPAPADNYFDRLDEAFATLSTAPTTPASGNAPSLMDNAIDWFSQPPPTPDAPTSQEPAPTAYAPAPTEYERAPTEDERTPTAPAAEVPTGHGEPGLPASAALPPLADAFAALLAAEQSAPSPAAAPVWPAYAAPAPGELADEVTRRVLQQLSDKVIRETVADIVSQVAERLVREEIESIKKSIK